MKTNLFPGTGTECGVPVNAEVNHKTNLPSLTTPRSELTFTNMIHTKYLLLLAVAMCLAACSTPSPRTVATPIYQGMTRAELLSAVGSPLRTEHNQDGSEDWFYNFGTQDRESRSSSEVGVNERARNYSVGRTTTTATTMTQFPIHLSPEGRVVGAIPVGGVIAE